MTLNELKTFIRDFLNENARGNNGFESRRINHNLNLLLDKIEAANHIVACYIILINCIDYISNSREAFNFTLNLQLNRYQQLLQTLLCTTFDLTKAITEEDENLNYDHIRTHLKESRNLKLVAKFGEKYFSNRDFNEYICSFIDKIRKNDDGSTIIESKRTNEVLDQVKNRIHKQPPGEVLLNLQMAITELNRRKVTFNETLNSQINHAINRINELIDFVKHDVTEKFSPVGSQSFETISRALILLPEANEELMNALSIICYGNDHATLDDVEILEVLVTLKHTIQAKNSPSNSNQLFFNANKTKLLSEIIKLIDSVTQQIERIEREATQVQNSIVTQHQAN